MILVNHEAAMETPRKGQGASGSLGIGGRGRKKMCHFLSFYHLAGKYYDIRYTDKEIFPS